jgi:hypothetical protein
MMTRSLATEATLRRIEALNMISDTPIALSVTEVVYNSATLLGYHTITGLASQRSRTRFVTIRNNKCCIVFKCKLSEPMISESSNKNCTRILQVSVEQWFTDASVTDR